MSPWFAQTCVKARYPCGVPARKVCGSKNCMCNPDSLEFFAMTEAAGEDNETEEMCKVTGVVERWESCMYDVNVDGNINVFDNMVIIDVILGKTEALVDSACHTLLPDFKPVDCLYDVNGDKNVDIGDVTKIFSVVSKA
eukprot:scaffold2157_cov376-Prasinococcus_capsulatus_cf.AAC.14